MKRGLVVLLVVLLGFSQLGRAQEETDNKLVVVDSTTISLNDNNLRQPSDSIETPVYALDAFDTDTPPSGFVSDTLMDMSSDILMKTKKEFKPNPTRAILYALIPGMGQIYNRKYWKLPLVYGAVVGCTYAISWNNKTYKGYWDAYKGVMAENPMAEGNRAWMDYATGVGNMTEAEWATWINNQGNRKSIQDRTERGKNTFRRYRDLSIIVSAGVYLISLLDAYVDAQLFDFDISSDLSMHVEPTITPKTSVTPQTYGIHCSIKF